MTPTRTAPRAYAKVGLALLLLAAAAPGAAAQGWIEPLEGRAGGVVRVGTDVQVRVVDQVAHVEVNDWFENRGRRIAEGIYFYPLPGEAVFGSFSLWQGDQELRGEVLDAKEARAIYEGIVRRRADPALVELAGSGLLRARVFPIEPGQRRRVTIRYTQMLARSGDALQFRYQAGPSAVGAVAPVQPVPTPLGQPVPPSVRPPEAPDLPPQAQDLELEIVVEDGSRFLGPFSPTHELEHERRDGQLFVRADGELRGRMSVFLPLAREGLGLSLATHRTPGEPGYFMLTLTPGTGEVRFEPRDVTVVLDVSGSMSGEKMEQARSAVLHLLETLGPEDRFRLIAFSNRVIPESEDWRPASREALRNARAWVERLQADGGTDISGALDEALRLTSPEDRLPLVVFVTDGLPTAGERNAERIAQRAEAARGRARVFSFGVGYDVDTHLLDALSAAARGTTTYVEPGENVARALELLAAKVRHPVLTDLEIAEAPARLREIYPVALPDLFAGESLVLFGRYEPAAEPGELRLTGRRAGEALSYTLEAAFPAEAVGNDYMPRLWASRKVGHLSRQIRLEGATPELVEELRRTALRYGLPSEYTSYLVVEPELAATGAARRRLPAATGEGVQGGRAEFRAADAGARAVQAAAGQARLREVRSGADLLEVEKSLVIAAPASAEERRVGGRLFRLRDGVWTEVRAAAPGSAEPRMVAVEPYSPAYFELLRALPELVPLASALGKLEVRGETATLRVADGGVSSLDAAELATLVRDFRGASAGSPGSSEP